MANIWLILLVIQAEAFSEITKYAEENAVDEKRFHQELIRKLFEQRAYNSVMIHNEKNKSEYCRKFLEYFSFQEMPTTVMTEHINFTFSNRFNNKVLCVVCFNSFYGDTLQQLANLLNHIRLSRVLAIMNAQPRNLFSPVMKDFFQRTRILKMLNVAVIFKDFYETRKFLQYTIFPEFKLELGEYEPHSKDISLFPERLLNLHGYKLRTIADHTEPRAMEYYNERREKILNGYIGRFVQVISKTLNSTLHFPLDLSPEIILDYQKIMDYVVNNSLDIPASSITVHEDAESRDFSYPFEMGKWCLLLPMEKPLKLAELYLRFLHSPIILLTLICIILFTLAFNLALLNQYSRNWRLNWPRAFVNDTAIRGVLGQTFIFFFNKRMSLKLIYVMLLFTGVIICTTLTAYLHSLFMYPPSQEQIKTYQDLFRSPIKVAISKTEIKTFHRLTNNTLTYLNPKFYVISNFMEFSRFRDKFDQRFAYPTISSKLFYYNSLQSYYGTKIVRFSADLCPNPMMQLRFPLGPNSVFLQRFDEIILRSLQAGLIQYWISKAFVDMKDSGRATCLNISYTDMEIPLHVNDLYWIWLYFVLAISLSVAVFLLEIMINKVCLK